jgi:hypothetical protein
LNHSIAANPENCKDCNLPKYCCLGVLCVLSSEKRNKNGVYNTSETLEQVEGKFLIEAEKLIGLYRDKYSKEYINWSDIVVDDLIKLITKGMEKVILEMKQ